MTVETFTPDLGVSMTPTAIAHTRKQLAKKPDALGIRLGVKKSGCSGYKYDTEWVTEPHEDDQIFDFDGVKVYVRQQHLGFVSGTEIDYVTQGVNSMFMFRNPNVTGECGCGESFTVS
ncbi:MAG: iron-sulfur cluster assembly accessory protein [Marinobacter sp.]|nr:iron-sulfur cluster assembly accessory protein [Marinobacter sp.]